MRVYIARHGQTAWNKIGRWQGNQDVFLDETGIAQANLLAEKLQIYQINKIYSSPLRRAALTAEIIGEKITADIVYREALKEIRLGEWEGFTTEEIVSKHGGLFGEWERNPAAQVGLGVENNLDLQRRAYGAFLDICDQETEDFLIVAHGAWTRCLMCKLLHIPLESRFSFDVGNTGVNVVECQKDGETRFSVITLNDMSHLIRGEH